MRVTPTSGEVRQKPSLFHSGVHSFASSVVSVFLSMVSSILIARSLGPALKGGADLIVATATLLTMALSLSIPSGIVYVVARGRAIIGGLLLQSGVLALVQTLLATGFLIALLRTDLSPALIPPDSEQWAVSAIGLLVLFGLLSGNLRGVLIALQEIPRVNTIALYGQALILMSILIVVALTLVGHQQFTTSTLVWIQVASALMTTCLLLWALRPNLAGPIRPRSGLREVIAYSLPAYLANLVQLLNYRLDIFFVGFFVGVKGVGLYALAVSLAQLLWLVSGAASQVLLPNVAASTDQRAAQERTARASRLSLWLCMILAVGVAVVGQVFLPLVFGAAFRDSVPPLLWLLPGIVAFSVANVIGSYLAGIGKPHLNLGVALVGLVATVMLDFALIPSWGIVGAAIASSASYLVTTLAIIAMFVRETGQPALNVLLLTRADMALLAATMRQFMVRGPNAT